MNGVGAVVGRFQVNRLHEGHTLLINQADRHKKLAIVLASPRTFTQESPLDFQTRKAMIQAAYPEAVVLHIIDQETDKGWSEALDAALQTMFPHDEITLYSGRDGFAGHYEGSLFVQGVETVSNTSGTEVRMDVGQTVLGTEDFRRGVIYGSRNQYARISPTVDIALMKEGKVLLAMRKTSERWRFPGGFVDITDASYESAARRELSEETGLGLEGKLEFVVSSIIPDWRNTASYRIFTTLFMGDYSWGAPQPKDDLAGGKLSWLPVNEATLSVMVPEHKDLFRALIRKVEA